MTPKNIHKIFIPQKLFIFLKTPKNIEIQNFETKKMTRAYVCMKISENPPPFYSPVLRQEGGPSLHLPVLRHTTTEVPDSS